MKRTRLLLALFISILAISCQNGGSNKGFSSKSDDKQAVSVWDNVAIKDSPEESGKWLSSLSIGETVHYLGKTIKDENAKKPVSYYNIRLKDNKEGWVQSDFIVLSSKPAAFIDDTPVYSRPDLLNKTDKQFSSMDIVAVVSENNGFLEVTGKRKEGKWIETGWVKDMSVTYSDVDIAVAKFARKAMDIADKDKRATAIDDIIKNSDLKESIFISKLVKEEVVNDAELEEIDDVEENNID